MSELFRNLSMFYGTPDAETGAFKCAVREIALAKIGKPASEAAPIDECGKFIKYEAVVTPRQLDEFLGETKNFISDLFALVGTLRAEKCLGAKGDWGRRLRAVNQDLPPMYELNAKLRTLAESYRRGDMGPKTLGREVEKLCGLP